MIVKSYESIKNINQLFPNNFDTTNVLYTNILIKTKLWRSLKSQYPRLRHRYEKDLVKAHQDLIGLTKIEGLKVEKKTMDLIRRDSKLFGNEDKCTSPLESLMQLSLLIR